MENLLNLFHGFSVILSWYNLGMMAIGLILGVLVGVLPGLGGPNGVAILLPLTFTMSPTSAIVMLSCIYWGSLFAGAITSILFNIPGESHSVATTFDGYPMAQQGRAGEALTASFTGSFFGALFSVLMITFLAPLVANFALHFGPPEFFAVYFLTFASFIGTGKDPFKTVISLMLGFGLAQIGMDNVSGTLRLTFGWSELLRGVDFLVVVIGLFGVAEILVSMEEGLKFEGVHAKINPTVVWQTWKKLPKYWLTLLFGAVIGAWMGFKPGGATAASFMSYGLAKRFSKNGDKFGTGELEGVLAPETAAHGSGCAALLADDGAGHPRLRHCGGAAGRPDDLGAAAGSAAVRRAKGLCLGPDRQHVSVERRRPGHRSVHRAAVRGDPSHPLFDHRPGHCRGVCGRRLHREQCHVQHLGHAAIRRYRLCL